MKHLVLGSEGQIGKYVCKEIEYNNDEVIRWDIALDARHDLSNFPFTSYSEAHNVFEEVDFVHFLAFNVGGSKYLAQHQNSFEYIHHNMRLMSNTFRLLKDTGKPFYFTSSQMSNMLDSSYGQLKAIGESYTKSLDGINVKFWNVYGYETDRDKSHVITDFIRMSLEDDRILCRTNGTEKRHFTYATDAARMLYKITQNYDKIKGIINNYWERDQYLSGADYLAVANDYENWYSIIDVAEAVCRQTRNYLGVTDWTHYNGFYSRTQDETQTKINEIPFQMKLWESLGLMPETYVRLEDGIKKMVKQIGKEYEQQ